MLPLMQPIEFMRFVNRCLARVLRVVGTIAAVIALCIAYARFVEPTWLCVRHITLSPSPTVRVIHITDIHFKGDTQYLEKVVAVINRLDADFVCFTGDLVEEAAFEEGALRILSKVNKPLYGVPGNHDQWVIRSFVRMRGVFRKTGGDWFSHETILVPSKRVALMTFAGCHEQTPPGYKRILMEHHPEAVEHLRGERFDAILAGHTHGGQVRIPFASRSALPIDIGKYDRGLYQTPCGPLYVNPGIGTFYLNMRFLCRPEITVLEI